MQSLIKLPLIVGSVLLFAATAAPAQEGVQEALNRQEQSINASVAVQQRINALDDETREMLNEYRRTTSQIQDLIAYNEQLAKLVSTQRVE